MERRKSQIARSLSDLGVRSEGKRDRNQNLCKFEANSELFNENFRKNGPIYRFCSRFILSPTGS
uniref:Uncharacterized protein n=1 Tax=Candidatus Kentrum sp. DK TaxID=2126562 RepID=A0A450SCT6_9GAMM|nr:MAG: hypothetical protein BECKDK2373C_GA0170839_102821 [Candidatus Kentron sp. DK]